MIRAIKKLACLVKGIFLKKKVDNIESRIKKYKKETYSDQSDIDFLEFINTSMKNNSKDLFELYNFKEHSIKLWEISEQTSRPPLVMIMGEFKTGKSTFINAILEDEILKSDVTPATAVVSMLSYGEERKVIAHLKDGSKQEYSYEDFKYITAEGDDSKREVRNNIKYVELSIKKEILKGITLIDTPGLNVDNDLHIQATKEFMNKADVVLWVFSYGKAASRSEIAAIGELSNRLKPIAVINRIDEIDEEEESLEDIILDIKQRLKGSVKDIIGVSSYLAKKGIIESDEEALRESKWTNFKSKFEKEVLENSKKIKIRSTVDKLGEILHELMESSKNNTRDISDLEEKFTDAREYKRKLLESIELLSDLLEKTTHKRENKIVVSTEAEYLYMCWENNKKEELDKVTMPLNYILSLVEPLKQIKDTERIIVNIENYREIINEIFIDLEKVNNRRSILDEESRELSSEIEEQRRQVYEYNQSGFFGGAPLFDWSGKGEALDNWGADIDDKVDDINERYRECESDRRVQFARITRTNLEIYDYLSRVEDIFRVTIEEKQNELDNFERNFLEDKERYELLKEETSKANQVIFNLKSMLENTTLPQKS